jgi:F0F1-type ATP synthase assembly protein I
MAAKPPPLRGGWRYVAVGADMVAATFVGAAIGYFLDKWLGTSPWMLIVWFVLGVTAGFVMVYRRMQFDAEQPPPEKRE